MGTQMNRNTILAHPCSVSSFDVLDRTSDVCSTAVHVDSTSIHDNAIVTADHGNADEMLDPAGGPKTSHTTNPVPLIVTAPGAVLREGGRLCDLAPTILGLMGLPSPPEMTGRNLLA